MIINFKIFENKSKFITVNYKIIIKDLKDSPTTLITDFKIVKHEDKKMIIKAKGYEKITTDEFKKIKIWSKFDDFKNDKTIKVWNKNFENGTKKIKVYLE